MDFTYYATITCDEQEYLVDFPAFNGGVFAGGESLREACANASTVLRLAIAEYLDSGWTIPVDATTIDEGYAVFTVEVSEDFIAETKCVTPSEAAEYLEVSIGRISQMLSEGKLEAYQHGGRRLVTIASMNARKAANPKPGRPRVSKTPC